MKIKYELKEKKKSLKFPEEPGKNFKIPRSPRKLLGIGIPTHPSWTFY